MVILTFQLFCFSRCKRLTYLQLKMGNDSAQRWDVTKLNLCQVPWKHQLEDAGGEQSASLMFGGDSSKSQANSPGCHTSCYQLAALPSFQQLAAISQQPCSEGCGKCRAATFAPRQAREPIFPRNMTESLVITYPKCNLGTIWEEQCEVIGVVLPIKCVKY